MKYKLISSATLPGKVQVTEKAPVEKKIQLTFFSFLVFLAGIPSAQVINLVGELYVTELLLPVLAIIIVLFGKSNISREKIFWQFVAAWICMILGYIISDLVAGTDPHNYLRGWGRVILLFTDMVALAIIVSADKRYIWWFLLGTVTGAALHLLFSHVPISDWKFGYSGPTVMLVLLLGIFFPKRITMYAFLFLAVISLTMDHRSMGAFCLIVAGIIFLRIKYPGGIKLRPMAIFRILLAGGIVIAMLLTLLAETKDEFSKRQETSSVGRFAGLKIGVIAVSDSPIIGFGSWGEGTKKYADMMYEEVAAEMTRLGSGAFGRAETFHPHSQILQAWIEGGLLAATFFFVLAYQLFMGLKHLILIRNLDGFSALYSFILVSTAWHLIMSPFTGGHRLQISTGIAIICILYIERRSTRTANNVEIKKI